jgi:dihydrofolate reductase / thymidylate synthase
MEILKQYMEFTIILAVDENNGIGKDNALPWKSNLDLTFFKEYTTGKYESFANYCGVDDHENENDQDSSKQNVLIMGRRTADGLKAPLPGRINMVITSREEYREGFEIVSSLNSALLALKKRKDIYRVFVIGGAQLYEDAILNTWCRRIMLTRIMGHRDCDTFISDEFMEVLKTTFTEDWAIGYDRDSVQSMSEYIYYNRAEQKYLELGRKIIKEGNYRQNRNAKTYSLFGEKLEFDIKERDDGSFEVPILTTKQIFTRGVNEELLFFMNGKTNTLELEEKKVMIWNGNTCPEFLEANNFDLQPGEMGPMYGFIWRHFGAVYRGASHDYTGEGVDQLQNCIMKLVTDPNSRRIVMTTYNPEQADNGVLYPCHGLMTQFYVEGDNRISLQTYQRSADYFLGLPFNIMSYSVFLCLVVKLVNAELERRGEEKRYSTGRMITVLGDVHIYSDLNEETGEGVDHITAVKEQLTRIDSTYRFPRIKIQKNIENLADLIDMTASDIKVVNYARHSAIRADMVA